MAVVNLTEETFEQTISSDGMVLVDWWASWCMPCRMFAPVFEAAAAAHEDLVFAKVDTQAEHGLAGKVGIMSIPTLMVFRDGILLYAQPGALPADALDDLINEAGSLDMDEVRQKVAAHTPR